MRSSRRAFTLVEIVVVVAIIAALMAMFFIGYRFVSQRGRDDQTTVMLNTARSMLADYIGSGASPVQLEAAYGGSSISAPGFVAEGAADRTGSEVTRTRDVLLRLMSLPDNKKVVEGLPAELVVRDGTQVVSLLDGYRNPIIYVPSGGLTGMTLTKGSSGDVIKSANKTGFFASAGEDGYFNKGDDNVYSTEVSK